MDGRGEPAGLGGLIDEGAARRLRRSLALTRHGAVLAASLWSLVLLEYGDRLGVGTGDGLLLWAAGVLVIAGVAGVRRRRLREALAGSTLVDDDGRLGGRAGSLPDPPAYRAVTRFFAVLLVAHVLLAVVNLAFGAPLHERAVLAIAVVVALVARRRPVRP